MRTPTVEELACELEKYDAAIEAARAGESYTVDGVTLTRQSLEALQLARNRIARTLDQVQAAANGAATPRIKVATLP